MKTMIEKREVAFNLFGPKMLPNKESKDQEVEALKFCQEYSKQRTWCRKHNLDYKSLDDEETY